MTKSQNTKNEQLTEQCKKGKLPYAEYYIKLAGGEYTNDVWDIGGWQSFNKKDDVVVEVLAPVPSYDELQNMNKAVNECMSANIKLVEENKQLKELLKKCKNILEEQTFCRNTTLETDETLRTRIVKKAEILAKIYEVLK